MRMRIFTTPRLPHIHINLHFPFTPHTILQSCPHHRSHLAYPHADPHNSALALQRFLPIHMNLLLYTPYYSRARTTGRTFPIRTRTRTTRRFHLFVFIFCFVVVQSSLFLSIVTCLPFATTHSLFLLCFLFSFFPGRLPYNPSPTR
jgi:hypothetical protein